MSAVDLATDEGLDCYVEEDDYDDHACELGTGDDFEDGSQSSSDDDEGRRSSQLVDYSDLQLEQDRRTRRHRESRGVEGAFGFLQDRREAALPRIVDCSVQGSQQMQDHLSQALDPARGPRFGIQRPTTRRAGGAALRGAAIGGEPAWRQGSRGTVAGITVFTNPAPSRGRVRNVEDPVHQSQPPSDGFNSSMEEVQLRRHGRCPRQQRQRKNGNWTDEQLRCAMAAVDDGKTMKKAAEENNIPYSSFRDHCYGKTRSRRRGVQGVLTPEEEKELVDYLVKMCDLGFGLSPSALKMKVYEITKNRFTPFRDGIPGGGWMRWFRHRHPELTVRAAQGLESARARALCPENVQTLYGNLERLYNMHKYPPERIWNCDESSAQAGNS